EEIKQILPHREPMLLVDEILSVTEPDARVKSVVRPDHLFLRADGTLSPEALIETVAQSFAACEAQRRELAGMSTDGGGYMASVREFEIFLPVRAGDELVTRVTLKDDFMGTRIVAGEVFRGEEKAAAGTVYIFMWEGKTPPIGGLL
ncbi:MAG: hypothetical protein ACI4Q7_05425, partial [Candidatus Avelusimicrobium sp.]